MLDQQAVSISLKQPAFILAKRIFSLFCFSVDLPVRPFLADQV